MRLSALLAFTALVMLASAQGIKDDARLSKPVTAKFHSMTMHDLLAKLGRQAGIELTADASIKDRMVYVSPRGKPLADLLEKIAQTFDLTWYRTVDGYKLRRSKEQADQLEAERAKMRRINSKKFVEGVKKELASRRTLAALTDSEREEQIAELKKMPEGQRARTDDETLWAAQEIALPDARFALQIMTSLSDRDWERLAKDGLLVCSTKPASGEVSLPETVKKMAAAWQSHEQEERAQTPIYIFDRWAPRTSVPNPELLEPGSNFEVIVWFRTPYEEDPSFTVPRWLEATVALVDRSGKIGVIAEQGTLFVNSTAEEEERTDPLFARAYKPPKELAEISRNRESFSRAYRSHERGFFEPLDLVVGPLLDDISSKMDVPIVVAVCDNLITADLDQVPDELEYTLGWLDLGHVDYVKQDGWLLGKPSLERRMVGETSCPRPILKRLFAMLSAPKVPSVETLTEMVGGLGWRGCESLCEVLGQTWPELNTFPSDFNTILFLAQLTPLERSRLFRERKLAISALTASQRRAIVDLLLASTVHGGGFDRYNEIPLMRRSGIPDDAEIALAYSVGFHGYLEKYASGSESDRTETRPCYSYRLLEEPAAEYEELMTRDTQAATDSEDDFQYNSVVVRGSGWSIRIDLIIQGAYYADLGTSMMLPFSDTAVDLNHPPRDLAEYLAKGKVELEKQRRDGNGGD